MKFFKNVFPLESHTELINYYEIKIFRVFDVLSLSLTIFQLYFINKKKKIKKIEEGKNIIFFYTITIDIITRRKHFDFS